jgi:hypothetical protein
VGYTSIRIHVFIIGRSDVDPGGVSLDKFDNLVDVIVGQIVPGEELLCSAIRILWKTDETSDGGLVDDGVRTVDVVGEL